MLFLTKQIRGSGRGHEIGFPTINLVIPNDLDILDGIYAVWIFVDGLKYKGALHYGPIPTFREDEKTMEVHLIGFTDGNIPKTEGKDIGIDFVSKIRDVWSFNGKDDLGEQIKIDIKDVLEKLK
jgi:riboflavin kinase/FMN adenylyltransferase